MNILYLLPDFPYPPFGGGQLRIMGLLPGAAQAGHKVHVLSFGSPQDAAASSPLHQIASSLQVIPPPQRSSQQRLQTLLLSQQADMETRRWSDAFLAALEHTLRQQAFDIVQCQSLEMTPYLPHVRRLQPQARLVYDAYNAESEIQRLAFKGDRQQIRRLPLALYSGIQWRRILAMEKRIFALVDAMLAVSEEDQAHIHQAAGHPPVFLVPNGIHSQDYAPPAPDPLPLHQPALLFTGIMDYRPNVDAALWFADSILPQITSPTHTYLVGKRPTAAVEALSQRANITVTGFVDAVEPYLHAATAFIAPFRIGSGTRFKLLQAMAAGKPVVSTTIGAMGLKVQDGDTLLIADRPDSFAAAIERLLQEPALQQRLGAAGQAFVRQHFDWAVIVPRLLDAYARLARP